MIFVGSNLMAMFNWNLEFLGNPVVATWIQTVVLFITAGLVSWYTVETAKLRREMVRQNQISLMPAVVPIFDEREGRRVFLLNNIGRGSAFNVRIEPISVKSDWKWEIVFLPLHYLASRETKQIFYWGEEDGKKIDASWKDNFFPHLIQEEKQLGLSFDDVQGGKYTIEVTIRPSRNKFSRDKNIELGPIRRHKT